MTVVEGGAFGGNPWEVIAATKTEERGKMIKVLEEYPDFKYEKISNRQLPIYYEPVAKI